MTVYADEAFLLNGAVDYLLLVCAAKLGGGRILRLRLALAAAFGGVYAAAALFPALAFLRQLPVKLASLAAMLLIAFGAGRGTLRTGALFFTAVCAFGGAAVAAAQSVVDEKRPIGADAKVFAAVEKPLNIAASVVLSEGASLEGVVNAFKGAFTAFCREGALTTRLVSYARVSAILLDQEGVADVTVFTLGGAGTSFALGEREIGVPGTVTLTEVTA